MVTFRIVQQAERQRRAMFARMRSQTPQSVTVQGQRFRRVSTRKLTREKPDRFRFRRVNRNTVQRLGFKERGRRGPRDDRVVEVATFSRSRFDVMRDERRRGTTL